MVVRWGQMRAGSEGTQEKSLENRRCMKVKITQEREVNLTLGWIISVNLLTK